MAEDTETDPATDTADEAQTPAPNGADTTVDAATDPDADQAERTKSLQRALGVKFAAAAFGEIVNVLMRAPSYKHYALAELEWLVVPAVVANQFSLAGARTDVAGLTVPVAVALWAKVSRETDARLSANPQIPLRLTPEEWTSGDILWLIDAVGPQQAVGPMIDRLRTTVFAGQPVKTRMMGKDAKPWIVTLEAKEQADAPEEGDAVEPGEAAQDAT